MTPEQRVHELGLVLPPAPVAGGNYVFVKTAGSLVFLAGVVSQNEHGVMAGTLGDDCSVEDGYAAARACGLLQLAVLRRHLHTLNAVKEIVSVTGYVAAASGFTGIPQVLNGFSDLMVAVYGDAGRHARASVGVAALPRGAMVEVQMTVALQT